jgi:poly(3-hydroxybutyrate) depolymerase
MIANMRRLLLLLACARAAIAAQPIMLDQTHESQVSGETRHYRIFLPPDYETSGKRYPVIYWFHGWSERNNNPVARDPGRCAYAPRGGHRRLYPLLPRAHERHRYHDDRSWRLWVAYAVFPNFRWAKPLGTMPETLHKLENRRRGDNHGN